MNRGESPTEEPDAAHWGRVVSADIFIFLNFPFFRIRVAVANLLARPWRGVIWPAGRGQAAGLPYLFSFDY